MAQTTYQVILSTDGKHTVIVTSDDPNAVKAASGWAKATYDAIVDKYGLKAYPKAAEGAHNQNGAVKESKVGEQVPLCAVHGVPMARVQGKHGPFWSCHERNPDDSWCSYKPSAAA